MIAPWSYLIDPVDGAPLRVDGTELVGTSSGRRYPVIDGIPCLLVEDQMGSGNRKFRRMYSRLAWLYDAGLWLGDLLTRGKIKALRRQLAATLPLRPGCRCLLTSIGTGADIPFVAERVPLDQVEFVGLDISRPMLRRCRRRIRSHAGSVLLVEANAEQLPFASAVFDIVVHVGGINFFDAPARAVAEMVRVGRPGAMMLIADETKRVVISHYQKSPLTRKYFKDAPTDFDPRHWLPANVTDVDYREVAEGKAYVLRFRSVSS